MSEFKKPTTPKQRREHRAKLEAIVEKFGFQQDRWGNWSCPRLPDRRIKFKDVNVRIERKTFDRWVSTNNSYVITQLDPEVWTSKIQIIMDMNSTK